MKIKLLTILGVLFFLSGCYIYRPYTPDAEEDFSLVDNGKGKSSKSVRSAGDTKSIREAGSKAEKPGMSAEEKRKEEEMKKRQEEEENYDDEDEEEDNQAEAKKREEQKRIEQQKREEERRRAEEEKKEEIKRNAEQPKEGIALGLNEKSEIERRKKEEIQKSQQMKEKRGDGSDKELIDSLNVRLMIKPNKFYKISAEGKRYKIQADKWVGDTLNAHIIRSPEKTLKFHKDQIDPQTVEVRKFSKFYSDLITVSSYAAAGFAVLLLLL